MTQPPPERRFDAAADAYESARPVYPDELGAWLRERAGLDRGSVVLELGAGTGELPRVLVGSG